MPYRISEKKPHALKKWLPAILAALALHLILIFAFLNTQNKVPNYTDSKSTSLNPKSPINTPNSVNVSTITDANQSASTDVAVNKRDNISLKDIKVDDQPSDISVDISNTNSRKDLKQSTLVPDDVGRFQESGKITKQQRNTQSSATIGTLNSKNINPSNSVNQSNTQSYVVTQISPDSNVGLLASDLPSPSKPNTPSSTSLKSVAQEVEDINAQLSATIDTVKEQNKRELAGIKTQEKNAYLIDRKIEVTKQVANVGNQLGIDELAESEFADIEAGDVAAK